MNSHLYITKQHRTMGFGKLAVFIYAGLLVSSCGMDPAAITATGTLVRSPTTTSSPAPTLTHTPTQTPTSTQTPTPTNTATPSPTFTPTPTPTLIGGFAGSYLTVEGSQDEGREIVLWSAGGRKIRTLWRSPAGLTAGGYVRANWSPTGEVISVEYWQEGGHLLLLSPDGTQIKTIDTRVNIFGGPNGQVNWSPDGRWLVFVGKGENDYVDVYRIDADGNNLLQLTNTYTAYDSPFFHPDGERIIFRDEGDSLYIMAAEGSDRRLLVGGPAAILDWSPGGKQAIFIKAYPPDIFLMDFETLALTRHTFDGTEMYEGIDSRFSPNGEWILYTGYGWPSTGNRDPQRGKYLSIIPVDMSQDPLLLAVVNQAKFSPDGSFIYFHGWKAGQDVTVAPPDYYRLRPDGTGLSKVEDNGYGLVYGIWSPP